jgi:hypothetical protein
VTSKGGDIIGGRAGSNMNRSRSKESRKMKVGSQHFKEYVDQPHGKDEIIGEGTLPTYD